MTRVVARRRSKPCPNLPDVWTTQGYMACNHFNARVDRRPMPRHTGVRTPSAQAGDSASTARDLHRHYAASANETRCHGRRAPACRRRRNGTWKGCSNDTSKTCSCTCRPVDHRSSGCCGQRHEHVDNRCRQRCVVHAPERRFPESSVQSADVAIWQRPVDELAGGFVANGKLVERGIHRNCVE